MADYGEGRGVRVESSEHTVLQLLYIVRCGEFESRCLMDAFASGMLLLVRLKMSVCHKGQLRHLHW